MKFLKFERHNTDYGQCIVCQWQWVYWPPALLLNEIAYDGFHDYGWMTLGWQRREACRVSTSWWTFNSAMWLSCGCDMVLRRYVFNGRRQLKLRSAVALEAGTTSNSSSSRSTSQKSDRTSGGFVRKKAANVETLANDCGLREHKLGSICNCNSRRPLSNTSYSAHNFFTPSPTVSPRQAEPTEGRQTDSISRPAAKIGAGTLYSVPPGPEFWEGTCLRASMASSPMKVLITVSESYHHTFCGTHIKLPFKGPVKKCIKPTL